MARLLRTFRLLTHVLAAAAAILCLLFVFLWARGLYAADVVCRSYMTRERHEVAGPWAAVNRYRTNVVRIANYIGGCSIEVTEISGSGGAPNFWKTGRARKTVEAQRSHFLIEPGVRSRDTVLRAPGVLITRGIRADRPFVLICVSYWLLIPILATLPVATFGRPLFILYRRRRRCRNGRCPTCDYDLRGISGPCPECGEVG